MKGLIEPPNQPIFDDWDELKDCNLCDNYWNNNCDGVSEGSERPCKTFIATRRVTIPLELKRSQNAIKWLSVVLYASCIMQVILWVIVLNGV